MISSTGTVPRRVQTTLHCMSHRNRLMTTRKGRGVNDNSRSHSRRSNEMEDALKRLNLVSQQPDRPCARR